MSEYIEFIMKLLLSYGMVFFLTYFVIVILHKKRTLRYRRYFIGILVAMIACFQIYVTEFFAFNDIADSKFVLAGLVTFFWGLGPGAIIAIIVSIFKYVVYDASILSNLILFGAYILFLKGGRIYFEKYKIEENFLTYALLSILSVVYILFIAEFIFESHIHFMTAKQYYVLILIIGTFIITALFFMVKRELDEIILIDSLKDQKSELLEQKVEIQALYEEMVASEETLKSNYDELKRYQEKVEFLAFHESQTGFSNKEHLYKCLRDYNESNLKVLLLLEVKEGNKLNYTLGNTLFDMLHFTIGAEIQQYFEQYSTNKLYSLGRGLFAVLLAIEISEDEIEGIFNSLNETFLKNELIKSMGLSVSLKAGAVHLDDDTLEPETWVEYAESALLISQRLKSSDKIVWFKYRYYEQMRAKSYLVTNLKKAITKSEFYVVYQPKYDHNGKLKSAEALIRWHNSEFGEIMPSTFIPLAEVNGVVAEIGEFVISSVCDLIKSVETMDMKCIPIAVNASIIEILNPKYSEKVFKTFSEKEVDHSSVHIEVTESAISESYEEVIRTLTTLSNEGVEIHLDDFGTGYSSLSHIGIMPISVIKIDKKFIDRIFKDEKYENLIEMMIDFSHRSNIKVVAEGVEDIAQFEWLKRRHCDYYQGYYFSKPISKEDFIELVKSHNE